jgi:hypothetical protein
MGCLASCLFEKVGICQLVNRYGFGLSTRLLDTLSCHECISAYEESNKKLSKDTLLTTDNASFEEITVFAFCNPDINAFGGVRPTCRRGSCVLL